MILNLGPAGSIGIIRGLPPYELPPEAWSAGKNVRMVNGAVHRFMGESSVLGTPPIQPYWLLPVFGTQLYTWLYAGANAVYATDQLTHTDISQSGGYKATPGSWTGAVLGGIPIINNGTNPPQMWNPPTLSTKLADLSNWPSGYRCKAMRAFKRQMIAMDIVDNAGNRYPHVVRWSHPADPGTVPSSWALNDPTKLSGDVPLSEHGGFIVDGATLGDNFIVYKENAIIGMQLVGLPSIFRPYNISNRYGMLSRHCVQEVEGRHIVVARGDIVQHDGTQRGPVSILREKQRSHLFSQIDPTNYNKCFTTVIPDLKEFMFCFPTLGSSYPNMALVWHWQSNTFSYREIDAYHIAEGIIDPGTQAGVIDSINVVIDQYDKLIDERGYNPAKVSLLMAKATAPKLLRFDDGFTFDGTAYTSYVERTGLAIVGKDRLGQWQADPKVWKFVKAIWPKVKSLSPVNVYVGAQYKYDGDVTWSGPKSYDPNTQDWIDFDVNAPLIAIRIEFPYSTEAILEDIALEVELTSQY